MKPIWTGRAAQAAARYGEHAPMAAVCCNACRTCASANALGIATATLMGAAAAVVGIAKRLTAR